LSFLLNSAYGGLINQLIQKSYPNLTVLKSNE